MVGRIIRIKVEDATRYPGLRFELYGCPHKGIFINTFVGSKSIESKLYFKIVSLNNQIKVLNILRSVSIINLKIWVET